MKISVLTPIYNHKLEFVRECLESLQAQTMQDIEFILIDNGATEEAKELIEYFINIQLYPSIIFTPAEVPSLSAPAFMSATASS